MLANISPDAKVSLHVLIGSWQLLLVVLLVANRIIFEQIRAKSMNGLSSRVLVNISPGAGYDSIKPAPLDRSPVRYCASHLTIKHQSFNSRKIESTLRSDSERALTRGRWKRRRYGDVQSLFESSCRQKCGLLVESRLMTTTHHSCCTTTLYQPYLHLCTSSSSGVPGPYGE